MDSNLEKVKKIKPKNYAHFGPRISMEKAWDYVTNPEKVARHPFFPFISFTKSYDKYDGKKREVKEKKRELAYSTHLDRCIYQYYAYLLNKAYNQETVKRGINDCAIAYRNNMGKNNIVFAKEAFDFIKTTKNAFVIVGDFKDFFGSLEHRYLKKQLCALLNCEALSADQYNIFKNITRYATVEMNDLLERNNLPKRRAGHKKLNEKKRVIELADFHALKKKSKSNGEKYLEVNKGTKGIPQGSAISAAYANIYMLDFDQELQSFVKANNGFYRRYSDDFIVVLPYAEKEVLLDQYNAIKATIKNIPELILESHKTQIFEYHDGNVKNCNAEYVEDGINGVDRIDYLGFSFNGKNIAIRDKTISKFYYRMYAKIKSICANNGISRKGNKISCGRLYEKYSIKHAFAPDDNGVEKTNNFLGYIIMAEKTFKGEAAISRIRKVNLAKIKNRMNKGFRIKRVIKPRGRYTDNNGLK